MTEFEGYGPKTSKNGHPQKEDQGYVDSGCSRHMTCNMSYLSDFKEFDRGYVTFGGGAKGGRITGKGTLKTGKLDFEDVYFVKELQFNLFSVSQMCDKKNSVLFTDTGCFVLSPDFKLADESQVLLKVPRKNNMYSVDMKNIVPKENLTCLVANATLDESILQVGWKFDDGFLCWIRLKLLRTFMESMNYVPLVVGTNSNDSADGSLFDSSLKDASNDEPQPSNDVEKKDDEGGIYNQESPEKNAQDVNIVGPIPSTPNTRIHKDHSLENVIGDVQSGVKTRRMINEQGFISTAYQRKNHEEIHTLSVCLFFFSLSQEEPNKVIQALKDASWIEAMQEELLQFKLQQVWTLVDLPYGKRAIWKQKWKDKDYDEDFAPVARIEAIRLFLAYASFKDFVVYQMDVKSAFLYGKIETKGQIDKTLFIKRVKGDILLVQVYVDDIIFGSTRKEMCTVPDELYGRAHFLLRTTKAEDIMFVVCACARFQVTPKAYTDSDYAGPSLDRKSTTRDETVIKEWEDRWKGSHYCFSLEAEHDSVNAVRLNLLLLAVLVYAARHTLTAVRHKLMLPGITYYCWFWTSAKAKTVNGERQIQALVDKKKKKSRRKQRKDNGLTEPVTNEVTNEAHVSTPSYDPPQSGEDRMQLSKLMSICTNLQEKVLDLEKDKTAQAKEIASVKKRVKVESSNDAILGEEVVAEKEIANKEVSTVDQLLLLVERDKGKAIMVEPEIPLKKKDQVALDEEMARNLEAQMQAELIEEERLARQKEEEANIALIES
ncbi:putative ribonuclease H-like domain-containing protein [Tanacetum coccineum]